MTTARDAILRIVRQLRQEDYAFTVTAHGPPWDVYRFALDGQRGTVALRIVSQRLEIGAFTRGELSESEVIRNLAKNAPS